jgi:hypothetical protein
MLLLVERAVMTRSSVQPDFTDVPSFFQMLIPNRQFVCAFGDKLRMEP